MLLKIIAKLVANNYKVGICEQLTEPNKKGLVERGIIRVITPGTLVDDSMLDQKSNNYLCSIFMLKDKILIKFYPDKYSDYVEKYSEEYGVDRNLVYAVIKQESNFREKAKSSKGAKGLMQIMNDTAIEIADELGYSGVNLYNAETNINIGTKYLADLIEKYENPKIAIAAYNAGFGNVDKWIAQGVIKEDGSNLEEIPYRETEMYLRKVMKNYEMYNKLYGVQ